MSRSRTTRPVRAWLAGTLLALLSAGASAAGPAKLASYDRTLWPESIDSPQRFDRASRQEILALVRVIERTPLADAAAIQTFTGVKTPNA
ncbi:polysaccharide deacetylase family protein, partial [Azotobacter chroococcum]|nr:polysaccharide deacetylase family protein [Azotobacter chroococcum]